MEPTIRAHDVKKGFGTGRSRTPILRGVSLEVGRGETVFLVGPSGSGKTTLLSLLGCILTPDEGRVEVLDQDVSRLRPDQLATFRREHLGFIFQSFNLFPTLSALDNVRLALTMRGVDAGASRRRSQELLERVGLGHRMRLRPAKLSGGENQRVSIARALAGDPAVLLADEPTASLDAENGQSVMHLLSDLKHDRGMTLVIVTHDNRIIPFADRILRLEDGRLAHGGMAPEPESAPVVASSGSQRAPRRRKTPAPASASAPPRPAVAATPAPRPPVVPPVPVGPEAPANGRIPFERRPEPLPHVEVTLAQPSAGHAVATAMATPRITTADGAGPPSIHPADQPVTIVCRPAGSFPTRVQPPPK